MVNKIHINFNKLAKFQIPKVFIVVEEIGKCSFSFHTIIWKYKDEKNGKRDWCLKPKNKRNSFHLIEGRRFRSSAEVDGGRLWGKRNCKRVNDKRLKFKSNYFFHFISRTISGTFFPTFLLQKSSAGTKFLSKVVAPMFLMKQM